MDHPAMTLARPLNHRERERVEMLERRRDYLVREHSGSSRALPWRKAEASALTWVIGLLRGDDDEGDDQ